MKQFMYPLYKYCLVGGGGGMYHFPWPNIFLRLLLERVYSVSSVYVVCVSLCVSVRRACILYVLVCVFMYDVLLCMCLCVCKFVSITAALRLCWSYIQYCVNYLLIN